ncbi:DHH family phosphoesterase [Agrilactobacillus fermenti]|uniref:DHH family phosphoesterase n=1 Tax=Agrilactobacillus fermenti TaxID=2586909 RepID=UPI001E39D660|nr:bifunctional oligoribonuclease/PAP phosphatase NrnA [Agrilactobacillus fermenti]MCD2256770.1 bifunctional oligoribonuclease/PAP phosphatase NrnA [Agrilactobacillus fermenti]
MSIFTDIINQIKAFETIIIHRHENPDPDAIGSQTGLASILRAAFPEKKIYQVGSENEGLSWIDTMQTIDDSMYQQALVIVCDTANTPRISDKRYDQGQSLIKIDHHPDDDHYGDLVYVDADASSTSEIIVELVHQSEGLLKLNDAAARKLYAGIVGDTGRFLYPSTSPETFKIAAELVSYNFEHNKVSQHMNEVTLQQARLQSYVYDHLQLNTQGAAYAVISLETMAKMGVSNDQAHAVVSTPGHLREAKAWFIAVEQPDHGYRIHLRSKGPVINELAKKHRGGGHPLASGAKASDTQEIEQIYSELEQLVSTEQIENEGHN